MKVIRLMKKDDLIIGEGWFVCVEREGDRGRRDSVRKLKHCHCRACVRSLLHSLRSSSGFPGPGLLHHNRVTILKANVKPLTIAAILLLLLLRHSRRAIVAHMCLLHLFANICLYKPHLYTLVCLCMIVCARVGTRPIYSHMEEQGGGGGRFRGPT